MIDENKSYYLWGNVAKNNDVLNYFSSKGLWPDIIKHIKNKDFWIKLPENDNVIKYFTDNNLWSLIFENIKSATFWNEVMRYHDVIKYFTDNKLWSKLNDSMLPYDLFWESEYLEFIEDLIDNEEIVGILNQQGVLKTIIKDLKFELYVKGLDITGGDEDEDWEEEMKEYHGRDYKKRWRKIWDWEDDVYKYYWLEQFINEIKNKKKKTSSR